MKRLHFAMFVLLFAAAACDDDPNPNASMTVDQLAANAREATCTRAVRCGGMPDLQTCLESISISSAQLNADIEAKRTFLNAAHASKCIDSMKDLSCDGDGVLDEACETAFTGTVAEGGDCYDDTVCVSLSCGTEDDCEAACCLGKCLPPPKANGESCSSNQDCDSWNCSEGVCVLSIRGAIGDGCQSGDDCDSEVCDNGKCADKRQAGADCTAPFECESLSCEDGKCQALAKVGESCSSSWDCESDRCFEGTCQALGKVGESCSDAWDCETGICVEGKCSERVAIGGPCGDDWDCVLYAGCVEGKCVMSGKVGDPCTLDESGWSNPPGCLGDLECIAGTCQHEADKACP